MSFAVIRTLTLMYVFFISFNKKNKECYKTVGATVLNCDTEWIAMQDGRAQDFYVNCQAIEDLWCYEIMFLTGTTVNNVRPVECSLG